LWAVENSSIQLTYNRSRQEDGAWPQQCRPATRSALTSPASSCTRTSLACSRDCRSAIYMQVDTPYTQAHHFFLVTLCPGHHQLSWAPYHPSRVSPNPEGLCFRLCVLSVFPESFPVSNQHDSRGSDSLRQLPLCEEPLLTGLTLRNLGVRAGFRARDSEGAAGKCVQLWRQVLCGVIESVGENEPRNHPAVTHSNPTLLPLQPER
jgi:hypothetical protein